MSNDREAVPPSGPERDPTALPVVSSREPEDLLEASLELAQTQLLGQLAEETSIDGETMGVLAFTGGLLAVDIASKSLLGTWWWTPLVGIGLATLACIQSIFGDPPDLGPSSLQFYVAYGGGESVAARAQLLADLDTAFQANATRARDKRTRLRRAVVIIVTGLILAALMISLGSPITLNGHGAHRNPAATASAAASA